MSEKDDILWKKMVLKEKGEQHKKMGGRGKGIDWNDVVLCIFLTMDGQCNKFEMRRQSFDVVKATGIAVIPQNKLVAVSVVMNARVNGSLLNLSER